MKVAKLVLLRNKRRLAGLLLAALLCAAPLMGATDGVLARDNVLTRNDLWRVIRYLCVPSAAIGIPVPCSEVVTPADGGAGWAILPVSSGHVLTVPTARVVGIESPELQRPDAPNYWQPAWAARRLLGSRGLDRTEVGLAVNSAQGRSQDQLHIHTACVRRDVLDVLEAERDRIGPSWARLHVPIDGVHYAARFVDGEDMSGIDPFRLLEPAARANPAAMARQTLVVVGARRPDGHPGFWVLNSRAGPHGNATGEMLLDFTCRH